MAKQYIKLPVSIVDDDVDLWKLSPNAKLVFFFLLPIAGKIDDGGRTMNVEGLYMKLYFPLGRIKESAFDEALQELDGIGYIRKNTDGTITVTNFVTYQETAMTGAERTAKSRAMKSRNDSCNEDVTTQRYTCNEDVTPDVTTERYSGNTACNENVTPELNIEIEKELKVKGVTKVTPYGDPAKPAIDWQRAFGPEAERAKAFSEASGIVPISKEYGRWQNDLRDFSKAGISIPQMIEAIRKVRREGKYPIKAPGTVLTEARNIAAKPQPQTLNDFPDAYTAMKTLTEHPEIIDL